jgi:hypothetical protein
MSEHDTGDDLPRDAWLREALRHAPDAEAGPPPKLNETILRMGRAAVAPRAERRPSPAMPLPSAPASGGFGQTLASWWSWLARPPVAAGFAGLMVATVVGVMWWDRPIEEALPPREDTSVAAAPAPSATAAPAEATAPKPAGLPEAAKRAAAPVFAEADQNKLRSATIAAPPAAAKAEPPPPMVAAAPATPISPSPSPAPAPAAATTQAPAPAIAADSAAREREAAGERRDAAAARMTTAVAPSATAASSYIETPSLSNLRFEIRRQADAWTWQRDEGDARPMDAAMENWIAQADRASRTVWLPGAVGPDNATTTLRFTRGGVVRAVLRIGPNGMRLTRGGKTESAELSRGVVSTLQGSLDALGP